MQHVNLTPLMHILWPITSICNVLLALELVIRKHFGRYFWLTLSTVLAVFCDAVLRTIYTQQHYVYSDASRVVYCVYLMLNLMVIFDSWKDKRVRIPVECQLALELATDLVQKAGLLWSAYYLGCFLRLSNLVMIGYFLYIFRKEADDDSVCRTG